MKTLKEGSGEEDRVKFLQEAAIMGQFKHPNMVEMYGVVTQGEPVSSIEVHINNNRKLVCSGANCSRIAPKRGPQEVFGGPQIR